MPADVAINRLTGSGPTVYTRIDSAGGLGATRISTSDAANPGTANPIPIPPGAAVSRSYWVVTQLETLTDPTGTINNLRWFTDGSNSWIGVNVVAATATAYVQATGAEGVAGTALNQTNYATLVENPVDAFTFTSAQPLLIAGSTTGIAKFGEFAVFQLEVSQDAVAGTLLDESFQIFYDET